MKNTFSGYFKAFVQWILVSSEDPQRVALTVKGLLVAGIPTIMWAFGGFAFFQHLTPDVINLIINYIVIVVADSLTVVGYGMAIYGAIRKIINTFFIPAVATTVTTTVATATPVFPDPRIPVIASAPIVPSVPQA